MVGPPVGGDCPRCARRRPAGSGRSPIRRPGSVRAAYAAASARLRRPSLARTLPTWCSTVLRLMKSRSAISGLDRPWPSRSSTSASRLVSTPVALARGAGRDAERPQQRGRGVDVARGVAAARTRRARPGPRPAPPRVARLQQRPGQLEPAAGELHRHLGPGEAGERLAQARLRVAGAGRQARPGRGPAPPTRDAGSGSGAARRTPRAAQPRRSALRRARPAARWTSTSSASSGAAAVLVRVDLLPARARGRRGRAPPRPGPGGWRPAGRAASAIAVEAVEQLLGLLEPALPDAQVGQPDERAAAQDERWPEPPEPDGLGQRRVGLGPAAGRRSGRRRSGCGRTPRPPGAAAARRSPRRPGSTGRRAATSWACSQAEKSWQKISSSDEEVVDLAARDRGERLVEQHHALLDVRSAWTRLAPR